MKLAIAVVAAALSAPAALAFAPARPLPISRSSPGLAPPLAAVNIDEGVSRDIGAMDEWASACTVQKADGFQLTTEDGLDFSVMTTQPLGEGSAILSVPHQMILTPGKAKQELQELGNVDAGADLLGRLGQGDQIPQFYLFLKVLHEYEKAEQSPWYHWLNGMPRLYYNAVSMTDFCYECLPPLVFYFAKMERNRFDNFFEALQKMDFISQETKEDKDLAKWAFNVVITRSWGKGDEQRLVPMADMFNHGTETEVEIRYDDDGNCLAYTTTDVPAGSPLRVSYGDPTNPSLLFARYGFLDETSPATFCKIMLNPTQQLKDIGYDHSRMLFYKDSGEISQEVWDVMLYQNLGASNRDEQQAFYEAHVGGDLETKQMIHQRHFAETASALKNHVDTFLKQLDELSAKGVGKDLNEHPRLPLILRHNEFVKTTFLTVKDRLDPVVEQATLQASA